MATITLINSGHSLTLTMAGEQAADLINQARSVTEPGAYFCVHETSRITYFPAGTVIEVTITDEHDGCLRRDDAETDQTAFWDIIERL